MAYLIVIPLIVIGLLTIGIVATALMVVVPELIIIVIDSWRYRKCHRLEKERKK